MKITDPLTNIAMWSEKPTPFLQSSGMWGLQYAHCHLLPQTSAHLLVSLSYTIIIQYSNNWQCYCNNNMGFREGKRVNQSQIKTCWGLCQVSEDLWHYQNGMYIKLYLEASHNWNDIVYLVCKKPQLWNTLIRRYMPAGMTQLTHLWKWRGKQTTLQVEDQR